MVPNTPNLFLPRSWLDRVPTRWLALAWLAAGALSAWWVYSIWTGPVVFWLGHKFALAAWTLPVLPLFALTWRWLERRRGRPWFAWVLVGAWSVLMAAPSPPQPLVVLDGATHRTVVSPWFWTVQTAMTVLPLVAAFGMFAAVIRARRAAGYRAPEA